MNKISFSRTHSLILVALSFLYTMALSATSTAHVESIAAQSATVTLEVPVPAGDCIYKDYMSLSTDNPAVDIGIHQPSIPASAVYDPAFKETKSAFDKPFSLSFTINSPTQPLPEKITLCFSYYCKAQKKMVQEMIPLSFGGDTANTLATTIETDSSSDLHQVQTARPDITTTKTKSDTAKPISWTEWLFDVVEKSSSLPLRIVFVLLLGLLMSLTPCIYPMIPITVGILQAQGSKSVWYNFLLALSYTFGIATTFAILGLVAAFTKQAFGSLLAQPLFVLAVVALLIYLGLSMLGLYEMYVPKFLQPKQHKVKGGSLISAYLFGAISGTFASPCISPGLVLLLTLVSAWGNKLLGFILLFVFGIGLSLPLLIIGSFSGSLALLPRAGAWMLEVKRFCGVIILGISFYFLQALIPYKLILLLVSLFMFGVGLFYFYSIQTHESNRWKAIKNIIGISFIAASVFFFVRFYSYTHVPTHDRWQHDYYDALITAKKEHKKLLVDVGAPFCSICKAIDEGLFSDATVIKELASCVTLKIDGSGDDRSCKTLKEKYPIFGFPTILLIDPETETVIKQWGAELYDMPSKQFIDELQKASKG